MDKQIDITPEHARMIRQLRETRDPSWGEIALLSCLEKLQSGGPTEAAEVKVHGGWAIDGFCLIYDSPWGPRVGLRAVESGEQATDVHWDEPPAEAFGKDIADFAVAEPLGSVSDRLVVDSNGLGWWGDPPFPTGGAHS